MLGSPWGEAEQVASYAQWRLRLAMLGVLLVAGALLLVGVALLRGAEITQVVLRNWIGYGGMALVSGWLFGSAFGWILPLAAYWLIRFYGLTTALGWAVWAWPHRPAGDGQALAQAIGWLLAGLLLVAWRPAARPAAALTDTD